MRYLLFLNHKIKPNQMKQISTLLLFSVISLMSFGQLSWLRMPDFPGAGKHGVVSFSINGKGYMGLGADSLFVKQTDWYEYDAAANAWTAKAAFPSVARAYTGLFVIGDKGYMVGGETNSGRLAELWEYNATLNTWTQKASIPGVGRMNPVGLSINGKGYSGSGFIGGQVSSDFYEYDPVANTWTSKANIPGSPRNGATGFNVGSKGYVGMGAAHNATAYYADFYEFDPSNNTWAQKADFPLSKFNNPVTYSSDTAGYVLSGYFYQNTGITHNPMNMFYKYSPSTDEWTLEGTFPGLPRGYAGGFALSNDLYLGGGGLANTPPNGPVYTDFWKLSNGLTTMIEPGSPDTGFKIFPNPTSALLFLQDEAAGERIEKIRVYDVNGKLLLSKVVEGATSSVSVSSLSAGLYFVEAITGNGKVLDGKFVKQ
jgi:N-acetylneuraminic acid mutarotase